MVNKPRQKGTAAETAVVRYLAKHGFPHAERRPLHGAYDLGDITGTPCLAWEVKNHKKYEFGTWMAETEIERTNARADHGILVVKPNGIGLDSAGDWWCVVPLRHMTELLLDAGYGDPKALTNEPKDTDQQ
jgi:hypothetical protein